MNKINKVIMKILIVFFCFGFWGHINASADTKIGGFCEFQGVFYEQVIGEKEGGEKYVEYEVMSMNMNAGDSSLETKKNYELVIPEEIKGIKVTGINESAFKDNTKLQTVTFNKNIKTIPYEAFSGCINLKSVHFTDAIKTIGAKAFFGCVSLTDITLPQSLNYLGLSAFGGCTNIESVDFADTPNGFVRWMGYPFSGSKWWKTCLLAQKPVILKKTLCHAMGLKGNVVLSGKEINGIASNAFENNTKVRSIKTSGVKFIGHQAFARCSVKSVEIKGDCQLEEALFYGDKKLRNVAIKGAHTYGADIFDGCKSIRKIVFGKEINKLYRGTFEKCSQLRTLKLLSEKKIVWKKENEIKHSANNDYLEGCNKLKDIYMMSSKVSKQMKHISDKKITLHVPKKSKRVYKKYTKCKVVSL